MGRQKPFTGICYLLHHCPQHCPGPVLSLSCPVLRLRVGCRHLRAGQSLLPEPHRRLSSLAQPSFARRPIASTSSSELGPCLKPHLRGYRRSCTSTISDVTFNALSLPPNALVSPSVHPIMVHLSYLHADNTHYPKRLNTHLLTGGFLAHKLPFSLLIPFLYKLFEKPCRCGISSLFFIPTILTLFYSIYIKKPRTRSQRKNFLLFLLPQLIQKNTNENVGDGVNGTSVPGCLDLFFSIILNMHIQYKQPLRTHIR